MRDTNYYIVQTMRFLVKSLTDGDYARIEQFTRGVQFSKEMLRESISAFGRTLVEPPAQEFDHIEVVEVTDSNPRRWAIAFDLWTEEEGRSDLTLECTLVDIKTDNLLAAEIDGIHVL